MAMIFVIKSYGEKEKFDPTKIINTCLRAGADRKTAEEVAKYIQSAVKKDTPTREIYNLILKELERREDRSSVLFRLRESIAMLDSESFEKYTQKILELNGYRCKWNQKIKGRFVEHQIDIVAKKDNSAFLVECKRHINPHRYTGLGIGLQVQARVEDVMDGWKDRKNPYRSALPWVIVNGKFSDHVKDYARGKNIRLTGWRYGDPPLEELIQNKGEFPVTILSKDRNLVREAMKNGILTVSEFMNSDISKKKNMRVLTAQARLLVP